MDSSFNVGDHIMQQGQAFTITSIQIVEKDNAEEKLLKYKPVFEIGRYKNMICSIPLTSLSLADIRKPISIEMAEEILSILGDEPDVEVQVNLKTAKSFEDSNVNIDTAKLAARLAEEKRDPETNFSSSKSFLLEKLIANLAQEFAIIRGIDLEEAESLIRMHLQVG